jgi:hypothetical protein
MRAVKGEIHANAWKRDGLWKWFEKAQLGGAPKEATTICGVNWVGSG